MPTPMTSDVAEAGLGEQLVDELGGGVERALGVVVDVLGRAPPRRARCARGRRPRRGCGRGRSRCRPPRPPSGRARAASAGARWPCWPGRRGRSARRSARAPGGRTTRLETVERDRPVTRAISARLAVPRSRRVSTTRRRLSSRNDSSDPVLTPGRPSRIPEAFVKSPHELVRSAAVRMFRTRRKPPAAPARARPPGRTGRRARRPARAPRRR